MNANITRETHVTDLGLIDYQKGWDFQTGLFNKLLAIKAENRNLPPDEQKLIPNYLIFCEHPHVFTLGRNGNENNLLIPRDELDGLHASYYQINRGGDITYHGPGQLVVYPIIDLENFFTDIHQYMRLLEESVIQTLHEFGIIAGRIPGQTGVWCDVDKGAAARKICAMGVKTSRWITMHGLALNADPDLSWFTHIVPCGIPDKGITSMEAETGRKPDIQIVRKILQEKIGTLFGMDYAI